MLILCLFGMIRQRICFGFLHGKKPLIGGLHLLSGLLEARLMPRIMHWISTNPQNLINLQFYGRVKMVNLEMSPMVKCSLKLKNWQMYSNLWMFKEGIGLQFISLWFQNCQLQCWHVLELVPLIL